MRTVRSTFLVGLVLSAVAISQNTPTLKTRPTLQTRPDAAGLPTEETVNSFLFQMFGYDPTITWKVGNIHPSEIAGLADVMVIVTTAQGSNPNRLLISADGKYAITGEILPFGAKPFLDAREKLEKGVNGPVKGPAKAPVTIVEFTDLQCPHCQKAAPAIEQLLALEPDARFIFQNFPLPSHNWAEKAAGYVDCLGRASNDSAWKFIQKTFDEQSNITEANVDEKLKAIATASGGNAEEVSACAIKPETKARIEASIALGRTVGVSGTPTLFINGRNVPGGAQVEVLKKIVDFQASQEKGNK